MVLYTCSLCDHTGFTTDWSLERHFNDFHKVVEGRMFKCPYCYEDQFNTKWSRLQHIYFSHRYATHCVLCVHDDFESANGLRRHFRSQHLKGAHRCRFCHVVFETKHDLETHVQIAHVQQWRWTFTPNADNQCPTPNDNSIISLTELQRRMDLILGSRILWSSHAVFVTKTDLKLNGRNIFTWSLRIGRPSIATYAGMKISNRPLHYDSISSGTTQKEKQDTTIRYESF